MDRRASGLTILRVCLGVFFVFEAVGKARWLIDSSILAGQLNGWLQSVGSASFSARYLHSIAIPWAVVFARFVPLAELAVGAALILGAWTRVAAALAFLMVLN